VSILVDEKTRVIVQGITGRDGAFHARQMRAYGTKVVGGVTPGKGGQKTEDGVPIFNTMAEAVAATEANTSVIYVPAAYATDAICEGADACVKLVVCITEGIPVLDMVRILPYIAERGARLIGPNCPGIISPGKCKVGIMPGDIHRPGRVGVVSRSGTLTYEVVHHLTSAGLGQSTCIGIGGDPIVGTNFLDALDLFARDDETDAVVLIGEIGGSDEEEAAAVIKSGYPKKVAAFIAGRTAPPGKRMGHAGAIVSGGTGTAAEKIAAFEAAGVKVAATPAEIAQIVSRLLASKHHGHGSRPPIPQGKRGRMHADTHGSKRNIQRRNPAHVKRGR
jgi:succinyl-CoA synthetase alpha subunit